MGDMPVGRVDGGEHHVTTRQAVLDVVLGPAGPDGLAEVQVTGCDLQGVCFAQLSGHLAPDHLGDLARALRTLAARLARPARAGEPWSAEEDDLLTRRTHDGAQPAAVAAELQRTPRAVQWRLYLLGLGPYPDAGLEPAPSSPAHEPAYRLEELRKAHPHSHRRWSAEEEQQLRDRHAQGATIEQLVSEFGRNEGGITARLTRLGLLTDPPAPPAATAPGPHEPPPSSATG